MASFGNSGWISYSRPSSSHVQNHGSHTLAVCILLVSSNTAFENVFHRARDGDVTFRIWSRKWLVALTEGSVFRLC